MDSDVRLSGWALILGASSGFGEATSLELARRGMDIAGVHLDRRSTLPNVDRITAGVRALGRKALFFNVNAADEEKRKQVLEQLAAETAGNASRVRVLMHSLAFGTLRPFTGPEAVTKTQIDMTLDVMAHSLVYWTQDLVARGLLGDGSRIFAMTSAGGRRIMPSYGPVSAAKAALESHIRQLACELAPSGIAANAINAGVTDTPALRKIPGSDRMLEVATSKNPGRRLTRPEDVAGAIAALTAAPAWLTGNVINVDGGEDVTG
jgi:NAD(P)-dependent dehydrogenase (short-subunit alcohol dehydrogenase family)